MSFQRGSVGIAVVCGTKDLQFQSWHGQNFVYQWYNRKDDNKEKEAGNGLSLKNIGPKLKRYRRSLAGPPFFTSQQQVLTTVRIGFADRWPTRFNRNKFFNRVEFFVGEKKVFLPFLEILQKSCWGNWDDWDDSNERFISPTEMKWLELR